MIIILFFLMSCMHGEVPADYYSGTDKIKGGDKPSAVVLDSFNLSSRQFQWSPSVDTETGSPVEEYFIFCYANYIPENIYDARYLAFQVNGSTYADISGYIVEKGNYYFMVVGNDGNRISERSNFINLSATETLYNTTYLFGKISTFEDSTARCFLE